MALTEISQAILILAVAVAITLAMGRPVPERGVDLLIRGVSLAAALLLGVLGGLGLALVAQSTFAHVVYASLVVGSVLFAAGALVWLGRAAHLLRLSGWLLLTLPMVYPTTLTLAAPLSVLMIAGLRRVLASGPGHVTGVRVRHA